MDDRKLTKHAAIRKIVQAGWGILSNGYIAGFIKGRIYRGPLKNFCVPGMNCYSCPGALGSCPIGAMQSVLDGRKRTFPFYVIGYLSIIGLMVGRFICGWLCLFGLLEELLYKIPTPKLRLPEKLDKVLRYLKYLILVIFVFALPFFYRSEYGVGEPFFCKFICPVGTLEGGIPLVLLNEGMRSAVGSLFKWKFVGLIMCLLTSVFIYRPFCKYICPLGAFYSLFQRVSFLRMSYDTNKCINCGTCAKKCKMNVDPVRNPNSIECIRCGECVKVCPQGALTFSSIKREQKLGTTEIDIKKTKETIQ